MERQDIINYFTFVKNTYSDCDSRFLLGAQNEQGVLVLDNVESILEEMNSTDDSFVNERIKHWNIFFEKDAILLNDLKNAYLDHLTI